MRRTRFNTRYGHMSGGSLYPLRNNAWFKKLQDDAFSYAKGWKTDSANAFKRESDYLAQKNSNQIRRNGGSVYNMRQLSSNIAPQQVPKKAMANITKLAQHQAQANLSATPTTKKVKFTPTISMMRKLKLK